MKAGCAYTAIDQGFPHKMRGTLQQTDTGLLWQPPSYKAWAAQGGVAPTTVYGPGMALGYFALHNRSGSAGVHGIGVRIPNYLWKAGQWTDATTTYTEDTTDAQDSDTNDFALETTTVNDGMVILSRVPFNAVSINVSTASVNSGTVARAARFSNEAGTGWSTALTNLFIQDGLATDYATGENLIVFGAPTDWGKSSSLATSLPDGYYAMNVRTTDAADTTAALAKAIELFRVYYLQEDVLDNATLLEEFSGREFVMGEHQGLIYGDALVPLFATANGQNRVTCQVRGV